jgi:hypothetical protein
MITILTEFIGSVKSSSKESSLDITSQPLHFFTSLALDTLFNEVTNLIFS